MSKRNMPNQNRSSFIFAGVVAFALMIAVGYVALSMQRPNRASTLVPQLGAPTSTLQNQRSVSTSVISSTDKIQLELPKMGTSAKESVTVPTKPFLVSLNLQSDPNIGKVRLASLTSPQKIDWLADLHCERVYFTGERGICLSRVVENISAYSVATIFDEKFQPEFQLKTDGIPSRARVSPDGRYAAFTLFVLGHSYADDNFSTATFILDTANGQSLGNLEEFAVFQDGVQISFPDFNFWGVTFTRDSNFFYATLKFNQTPYLVKGDVQTRSITVLHEGVECPSLSPDETRIAFKKLVSRLHWQLTVMDLATYAETPLSEAQSVDDQAEWLDNDRILYAIIDPNLPAARSIMVVNADGSGEPQLFAAATESPSVVR